ncbi:caspase family protein [Pedobacter foliorum]|uniref:caspase family protein n=1 Tax=Pedobacter foliorum TaxID=2739058 RepID=UPI0015661F4B|nr:caspase family protein [Pedobacter foliorum]NRF37966.1 caspase family protein [Pedobacter foliorum]
MKKIKGTLLLGGLMICIAMQVFAQSGEERDKDVEAHKKAYKLYEQAKKSWKEGDYVTADKQYRESITTYPLLNSLSDFPKHKMKIGDIKGANAEWDLILKVIRGYPRILVENEGNIVRRYTYQSVDKFLIRAYNDRASANVFDGDLKQTLNDYRALEKLGGLVTDMLGQVTNSGLLTSDKYTAFGEMAIQSGDFTAARHCIDTLNKFYEGKRGHGDRQLSPVYLSARLALAEEKYEEAIALCDRVGKEDKGISRYWRDKAKLTKAQAYAKMGNVAQARIAFKEASFSEKIPDVAYTSGLIELAAKAYEPAIAKFKAAFEFKYNDLIINETSGSWAKYRYLTGRAEAHAGLKDYTKAQTDYELALLYKDDYQPAINGLAQLESHLVQEAKSDKSPPEIVITEPDIKRGLKITAAEATVMIKGVAKDPSGLKSVTINGNKIYAQNGGDFWGDVRLVDGINKFTLVAEDASGNNGELVFEIEKITQVAGNEISPVITQEGKNYCLLIAAQNYDDSSIPSLENPIADAIKLKLILKSNYNFVESNILTLFNPGNKEIKRQLMELTSTLQPEDNLLIFYAGHGIWVEKEKKGYWLLTDAKYKDINTWLPNKDVLDLIAKLPSRHTLLITDACFSGSVFKTRGLKDAPPAIKEMENKITRVAITSGNDTEVPDVSVFMKYLVKALSDNKEKYLTAQKMFINQIIEAVMTESKTEPRYGTLELAGHVGGDFIFTKK